MMNMLGMTTMTYQFSEPEVRKIAKNFFGERGEKMFPSIKSDQHLIYGTFQVTDIPQPFNGGSITCYDYAKRSDPATVIRAVSSSQLATGLGMDVSTVTKKKFSPWTRMFGTTYFTSTHDLKEPLGRHKATLAGAHGHKNMARDVFDPIFDYIVGFPRPAGIAPKPAPPAAPAAPAPAVAPAPQRKRERESESDESHIVTRQVDPNKDNMDLVKLLNEVGTKLSCVQKADHIRACKQLKKDNPNMTNEEYVLCFSGLI